MPKVVAIQKVERAFLARQDCEMWRCSCTRLIGELQQSPPAEIEIVVVESAPVAWREAVNRGQSRRDLDHAFAMIPVAIDTPVSCDGVDVPARVRGQRAQHPVAAHRAIGSRAINRDLRQRARAVGHDPSVIWTVVAVGSPTDIDVAVGQQQRRTLILNRRIECWTRCRSLDHD